MRRRKRFRKKSGHKRTRYYTLARGGIQLSLLAFFVGVAVSCTLKHKLLPTSIDVNTIEIVTDSISPDDKYLIFN